MILLDPRSGSKELLPKFKALRIPAELSTTEMPYGDFTFEGRGPGGKSIMIGVERKTVRDMLNCITTGRFSGHQLKGMLEMYFRAYVILEGIHQPGGDGVLEENGFPKGWRPVQTGSIRYMYSRLDNFINSIEESTPIRFKFASNKTMTVMQIANLYRFWNDKEYDEHKAADGIHNVPRVEIFEKWSFPRIFAHELPGIKDAAKMVARHFVTVHNMVNAKIQDWAEVQVPNGKSTKRIGIKTAEKIVNRIEEMEI